MSSKTLSSQSKSSRTDDVAVAVRDVSKTYTILHNQQRHSTAAEALVYKLKNPLQRPQKEDFQALREVSFDVRRGEVVGIIGRNGAGKSTLLKILSQITEPTTGQIDLYGRVGSLLEVGTGFHPELTGRENIFLNGAILGMRRKEIERQFDAIVDFAGTEQFLDTPVKRYSSGMYVRLAFAVAAHLHPEILIVDEVLAVGDAEFQRKCLGKMENVAHQEGRTVLFVSHNMVAIRTLCNRTLLLQDGQILFDGDSARATEYYLSLAQAGGAAELKGEHDLSRRKNLHLSGTPLIQKVAILDAEGRITPNVYMGQEMSIAIDVEGMADYPGTQFFILLKSETDQLLMRCSTRMKPAQSLDKRQQREQIVFRLPRVPFTPGAYWFDVIIKQRKATLDHAERAGGFNVVETDVLGSGYRFSHRDGLLYCDGDWAVRGLN